MIELWQKKPLNAKRKHYRVKKRNRKKIYSVYNKPVYRRFGSCIHKARRTRRFGSGEWLTYCIKGQTWGEGLLSFCNGCGDGEVGATEAIPPSWRQKSLQYKKSGHIASRTQQSNSLCRAVKPPPFDKGDKDIVLFEGKCGFGRVGEERWQLKYNNTKSGHSVSL